MTPEHAFLHAIKEEPEDDTVRLVFGDWLEENDQLERAEFLRLQIRRARLAEDDPAQQPLAERERELVAQHQGAWLGSLRGHLRNWTWQRGLLHVKMDRQGLEGAQALAGEEALAWVEGLQVHGLGGDSDALVACPLLGHLARLHLPWNRLGAEGVEALVSSPYLPYLATLHLGWNAIGVAGAAALASSPHLARLTMLSLWGNGIGVEGAEALASSPHLRRLTELGLGDNRIGDEGALALASSPHLARLATLDLWDNGIGAVGAEALRRRFGPRVRL